MSDNEDFMMDDVDEEDYGFDYEDDDQDDDLPDADVENLYYNAKAKREDDRDGAMADFLRVVDREEHKGDWGFKALKQLCKMTFRAGHYDDALQHYRQLLTYTKSAVTRNYGEKSINNILDYVSAASDAGSVLEDFYSTTLDALREQSNDRLWIKTKLKLAKLWLDRREYPKLIKILRELHASVQANDAESGIASADPTLASQLTEICAIEIQMYTNLNDQKRLKQVYRDSLSIRSSGAISHPRTLGVIRECGGKMHMRDQEWSKAQTDFFEAFKCYDESGSPQRLQVLKYLVLASMLSRSEVDPFSAQETKPYASDPQIRAMTSLVAAFQARQIDEFQRILRENRTAIMSDAFIRDHIDDVLKEIRLQVLTELIPSYTRVQLSYLAEQLSVTEDEVEGLVVELITDKRVHGQIDQVQQVLVLHESSGDAEQYKAMEQWAKGVPGLLQIALQPVNLM